MLKELARRLLSQPLVRRTLRVLTALRWLPQSWRNLLVVKLANRVRFRDGEAFKYRTPTGQTVWFLNRDSANYLYWLGEYEPGSMELFTALCQEADVLFDVGSNVGLYAIVGAAANPHLTVLAFEPFAPAIEINRRNLALNDCITRHVDLLPIALGERTGKAKLFMAGGASSLNAEFRPDVDRTEVTVVSGDEVVHSRGIARVDLIKLDTEATEPLVLKGFSATLARDHPDILCEVLHGRTETNLEVIVGALGYTAYWITSEGLHKRDHIVGDPTYRFPNYLFTIRPPGALAALGVEVFVDE